MQDPGFVPSNGTEVFQGLSVSLFVAGLCLLPVPLLAQNAVPVAKGKEPDAGEVEIRANRSNDNEVRRQSTAAKIVIGRDEIERQGDATIGEVLRRLPGVTMQGPPGRGGGIRMRGLGSGYTQILLDGERVPPGFSIESLTPEQIERIEILRAPTAETGARAIGGTINIILREGQRANPDDLKITRSMEHGEGTSQAQWVHNLRGALTGNFTLSLLDQYRTDSNTILTESSRTGAPDEERVRTAQWLGHRQSFHGSARLQWRGDRGQSLTLMPFLVYSGYQSNGRVGLKSTLEPSSPAAMAVFDAGSVDTSNRFAMARLNGMWAQRPSANDRLEMRFGLGQSRYDSRLDQRADPAGPGLLFNQFETQNFTDSSFSLNGKWTRAFDSGHQWVSGIEAEGVNRDEAANAALSDDSGNLQARTRRWALYTQDEWRVSPQWSAHAGLRHERITTEGTGEQGMRNNQSAVWSPLAHALWRPRPDSRDQIRISLTRSYKTPTLYNLVARPVPSREANSPTRPDRVGNIDLKPELAAGIDLAAERYLPGGGVLSANLFHRRISDLIRYVTLQQMSPSWAPGEQRWVSVPMNVGDAVTQGIELEAKFRLDQIRDGNLPIEIRSNLSVFRSRVKDVPGPDNRLDQQPGMTANFGADYRMRSAPITLGGNLNINPAYDTRRTLEQWVYQGSKRVLDVYGLWRISPGAGLRMTVSNFMPRSHVTGSRFEGFGYAESSRTETGNWRNVQMRLELKI
jgi:outer membrane receptor for ferrienterochelin and colicins